MRPLSIKISKNIPTFDLFLDRYQDFLSPAFFSLQRNFHFSSLIMVRYYVHASRISKDRVYYRCEFCEKEKGRRSRVVEHSHGLTPQEALFYDSNGNHEVHRVSDCMKHPGECCSMSIQVSVNTRRC